MSTASRRGFLGFLRSAAIAAPLVTAPALPAPSRRVIGPITVDQYLAEMDAIGWTCFAGVLRLSDGSEKPTPLTIEYGPEDASGSDYAAQDRRTHLVRCIGESGTDFYARVSARLHALGRRKVLNDRPARKASEA